MVNNYKMVIENKGEIKVNKIFLNALNNIDAIYRKKSPLKERTTFEDIRLAEKRLKIKLPSILREFYERYNKDDNIMYSSYIVSNLSQLKIEDGYLVIAYSNEEVEKYAIDIRDLDKELIPIKKKVDEEWKSQGLLIDFILNLVSFQVINALEYSVVAYTTLEEVEEILVPIYRKNINENIPRSFISKEKDILGIYIPDDNIYLGANEDYILENFEREYDIDLDLL